MPKVMFSIMSEERSSGSKNKNPIYVNISAGTSEFSAAALIASMVFDNVVVFSVFTKEHTIGDKKETCITTRMENSSVSPKPSRILSP
jgi:hypothetical protein